MTKEDAKKNYADWANISENLLMFIKEVKDSFHFIYERNNRYLKVAISKTNGRFYSISSTITKDEIKKYEKLNNTQDLTLSCEGDLWRKL